MLRIMASILLVCLIVGLTQGVEARRKRFNVMIDKKDIDLVSRTIQFTASRRVESAEIRVYDLEGQLISERLALFKGAPAKTKLSISWPVLTNDADNFKIELRVTDVHEAWVNWEIVHFFGTIPHEEVVFETAESEIRPQEAYKLEVVLPKLREMLEKFKKFTGHQEYGLYIAGYTDTVGSKADNRSLSLKRARAIAKYLLRSGVRRSGASTWVRGFGEEVLAVQTADEVAEERNRRAEYIVSNFPPEMPGPGSWIRIK